MARKVSIGYQEFDDMIRGNLFYIDKTGFIKEWWDRRDKVTLITRPRRFGKTLTMDMVRKFFSIEHPENRELFQELNIWKDPYYQEIQGKYPVISLSFSDIKENSYPQVRKKICEVIVDLYNYFYFLTE